MKRVIIPLLLAAFSTTAFAVTDSEVFAFAAANYPYLFSGTPTTGQYLQYHYSYYPDTMNYLAVDNAGVIFILGPASNNQIEAIAPVSDYEAAITQWESSTNQKLSLSCNSATAPNGINYTQSGNTITVTTTGCIPVPTGSACNPSASQATGVNVVMTESVQSYNFSGITLNLPPGIPNPLNSMVSSIGNSSICIKNAPLDFASLVINTNICFDVTPQLSSTISLLQSGGLGSFGSATPPVTMSMQSTSTMKYVPDCLTSGANVIMDAFTGQTMVKQSNGTYSNNTVNPATP